MYSYFNFGHRVLIAVVVLLFGFLRMVAAITRMQWVGSFGARKIEFLERLREYPHHDEMRTKRAGSAIAFAKCI